MPVPFVTDLANAVGGNLATGIADIIRLFKVDPNLALEKQADILKIQADLQTKVLDSAAAAVQAASANIQAEAKSGDKFTSRPRPLFMYLIEFILAFNYIIVPTYHLATHQALAPYELPTNLLTLFGMCILGYTTYDQVVKIMQMPGDSSIKLPFGVQVGQNSPK